MYFEDEDVRCREGTQTLLGQGQRPRVRNSISEKQRRIRLAARTYFEWKFDRIAVLIG